MLLLEASYTAEKFRQLVNIECCLSLMIMPIFFYQRKAAEPVGFCPAMTVLDLKEEKCSIFFLEMTPLL